jgi:hypothetical protein
MTTMIAKLTSPDLTERAAIVAEIIEDIERENLEGSQPAVVNPLISLQDIHVGRPIDSLTSKKFIEKEEMSNGIDHQTVIAFFRQPLRTKPKGKRIRRQSKEKSSVKNSREKSEKSHSKKSADSKHRKISQDKQKTNSFNESKDSKESKHPEQKQSRKQFQDSPKKTLPSKDLTKKEHSKEHLKKEHTSKDFMKREGIKTAYLEEERSRLMLPKSPKVSQAAKMTSPVLRNKSPPAKERLK